MPIRYKIISSMLQITPFHLPNYKSFLFMGKGAQPPFPHPSPRQGKAQWSFPHLFFLANDHWGHPKHWYGNATAQLIQSCLPTLALNCTRTKSKAYSIFSDPLATGPGQPGQRPISVCSWSQFVQLQNRNAQLKKVMCAIKSRSYRHFGQTGDLCAD